MVRVSLTPALTAIPYLSGIPWWRIPILCQLIWQHLIITLQPRCEGNWGSWISYPCFNHSKQKSQYPNFGEALSTPMLGWQGQCMTHLPTASHRAKTEIIKALQEPTRPLETAHHEGKRRCAWIRQDSVNFWSILRRYISVHEEQALSSASYKSAKQQL